MYKYHPDLEQGYQSYWNRVDVDYEQKDQPMRDKSHDQFNLPKTHSYRKIQSRWGQNRVKSLSKVVSEQSQKPSNTERNHYEDQDARDDRPLTFQQYLQMDKEQETTPIMSTSTLALRRDTTTTNHKNAILLKQRDIQRKYKDKLETLQKPLLVAISDANKCYTQSCLIMEKELAEQ